MTASISGYVSSPNAIGMQSARIFSLLLVVQLCRAFTAATVPQFSADVQHTRQLLQSHGHSRWHATVQHSHDTADKLLTAAGISKSDRAHRILIPMLSKRRDMLCRFITSYAENVAPNNPADLLVFSYQNAVKDKFRSECLPAASRDLTVHFMPVREHWEAPEGSAADPDLWSKKHFSAQYRQMGHWRLVFPFNLAMLLGYKYLWQLDDDSRLVLPVETNLISWMKDNNMSIGFRGAAPDIVGVTWALPELTRAFLVAEQYEPAGTVFQHTDPPGIDGLYTSKTLNNSSFQNPDGGGWDRTVMFGNCIMFDLDFWFQPIVQRFLELVLRSGYHYRFRWNEQSTIAMIWQVFVPDEQSDFLPIPPEGYQHKGGLVEVEYRTGPRH